MNYIREAEEYLKNYNDYVNSIEIIKEEIEILDMELQNVKAIEYTDMPKGGGAALPDDRQADIIYKKQIKSEALRITKAKLDLIKSVLEKLGHDKKVLEKFYIENLRGQVLEREFSMSERNIYRAKGKAIRRFACNLFGIEVN